MDPGYRKTIRDVEEVMAEKTRGTELIVAGTLTWNLGIRVAG